MNAPARTEAACLACDDAGHVHGYAGRAEPCHCLHSAATPPQPPQAADEPPGPVKAGPGEGGRP